jgi:hypothetical protein
MIRKPHAAAGRAEELGLRLAVGLIDVATGRTGEGRVPGIHRHHEHPGRFRLVGNALAQLGESPGGERRSLRAPNRCPVPDAPQVFQGDPASGVLRSGDDLFRDSVVGVGGEAPFLAATPVVASAGAARKLLRELRPQPPVAAAQDQQERAARLLGAADALREAIRLPALSSFEHRHIDREIAAVLAVLDEGAFAAVWAEGRAMTIEQAIQYALEETSST